MGRGFIEGILWEIIFEQRTAGGKGISMSLYKEKHCG